MSWTDKQAIVVIKYLRDKYKIKTFIETGTFKGINAQLHSKNFDAVITYEKIKKYYNEAHRRLNSILNVFIFNEESQNSLKKWQTNEMIIFYLDAHFYDKSLPKNKRFVVLDELKALKGRKNSIIIIHDFDNGLGHIVYDGQPLNLKLIKKDLFNVNSKFQLYTNNLESCNPVTLNYKDITDSGLNLDMETIDNINYAWTAPRLTYRGILYCLPSKLSNKEMKELGLRKWN